MIQISPEQEVYSEIRRLCDVDLGYSVYDYRPDSGTEYPFIVLGDQTSQNIREHKDFYNKDTQLTIHFWHNEWHQRGTLTTMMNKVEKAIIQKFGVKGEDITTEIRGDPEDNSLMRGILETDIRL